MHLFPGKEFAVYSGSWCRGVAQTCTLSGPVLLLGCQLPELGLQEAVIWSEWMGVSRLIAVVHLIPFLWTLCLGNFILACLVSTGG